MINAILTKFMTLLANRIADEVILILRQRVQMTEIEKEATGLKAELAQAQSDAEREAVLDKVYKLINNLGSV